VPPCAVQTHPGCDAGPCPLSPRGLPLPPATSPAPLTHLQHRRCTTSLAPTPAAHQPPAQPPFVCDLPPSICNLPLSICYLPPPPAATTRAPRPRPAPQRTPTSAHRRPLPRQHQRTTDACRSPGRCPKPPLATAHPLESSSTPTAPHALSAGTCLEVFVLPLDPSLSSPMHPVLYCIVWYGCCSDCVLRQCAVLYCTHCVSLLLVSVHSGDPGSWCLAPGTAFCTSWPLTSPRLRMASSCLPAGPPPLTPCQVLSTATAACCPLPNPPLNCNSCQLPTANPPQQPSSAHCQPPFTGNNCELPTACCQLSSTAPTAPTARTPSALLQTVSPGIPEACLSMAGTSSAPLTLGLL